eukprot:3603253-Prymnesium_polylepis.1
MSPKKKKISSSGKRKTQEEILRPYLQTISDLNATVRKLERRLRGGADGDLIMQKQAAEEQR